MIGGGEPDRVAACHCCCHFRGEEAPTRPDRQRSRGPRLAIWLLLGSHVGSVDGTAERMIFPGRLLFSGCDARVKKDIDRNAAPGPDGSVYARPEVDEKLPAPVPNLMREWPAPSSAARRTLSTP
jgi:hypothetical protein